MSNPKDEFVPWKRFIELIGLDGEKVYSTLEYYTYANEYIICFHGTSLKYGQLSYIVPDTYSNLLEGVTKRILCCKPKESERYLLECIKNLTGEYAVSSELISKMEQWAQNVNEPTISPWLIHDYNTILNGLYTRGFHVERLTPNEIRKRYPTLNCYDDFLEYYVFHHNDTVFAIPTADDKGPSIALRNHQDEPYWSLKKILGEYQVQEAYAENRFIKTILFYENDFHSDLRSIQDTCDWVYRRDDKNSPFVMFVFKKSLNKK